MPHESKYDENLLASAPKATKAQLQDGYNPDILVEKPTPNNATTAVVDPEAANRVQTPVKRQESGSFINEKKRPFYTTRTGIIVIAVALLVIIVVAVVGGVVGSRKTHDDSANSGVNGSPASATSLLPSGSGQIISGSTKGATATSSSSRGGQSFGTALPTPTPSSAQGTGGTSNGIGS